MDKLEKHGYQMSEDHLAELHKRNEHPRYRKLQQLEARGISVPATAFRDAAADTPGPVTQQWSWWAHVWPRPNEYTFEGSDFAYQAARESWEASDRFTTGQNELYAERQRRNAEAEAARIAEDEARRSAEADQVKAELRESFMRLPGTTEADFEAMYPSLLEDRRRREMAQADAMAAEIRKSARVGFGG